MQKIIIHIDGSVQVDGRFMTFEEFAKQDWDQIVPETRSSFSGYIAPTCIDFNGEICEITECAPESCCPDTQLRASLDDTWIL